MRPKPEFLPPQALELHALILSLQVVPDGVNAHHSALTLPKYEADEVLEALSLTRAEETHVLFRVFLGSCKVFLAEGQAVVKRPQTAEKPSAQLPM